MTAGPAGGDAGVQAAVLAGLRAGKPMRAIAVELYGADLVAAEWDYDGGMRARMRRLAARARAASVERPGAAARGTP